MYAFCYLWFHPLFIPVPLRKSKYKLIQISVKNNRTTTYRLRCKDMYKNRQNLRFSTFKNRPNENLFKTSLGKKIRNQISCVSLREMILWFQSRDFLPLPGNRKQNCHGCRLEKTFLLSLLILRKKEGKTGSNRL